jgi:hypothetical protein
LNFRDFFNFVNFMLVTLGIFLKKFFINFSAQTNLR